ncbi:MAG: DnaJ domain-containing protein [Synechococcus sp. SB0668_bin_15]|nr:DnaJ domain-containing protein [Synechococcus sp. SB0668_bin_15]MYC50299.1 DnaJ domain-containing protein [Synechococcus sp. SB0662_bin_14]
MTRDFYTELGLSPTATAAEIKVAYRQLVKRHHPDAGGDQQRIVAINLAYGVLSQMETRQAYDATRQGHCQRQTAHHAGSRRQQQRWSPPPSPRSTGEAYQWLRVVFDPANRQLSKIITPFPGQLRSLAANPYDDRTMATFCHYILDGQRRVDLVQALYQSCCAPPALTGLSTDLYRCFRHVQEGLSQLSFYTRGYVDDYLRDGREVMRLARQLRHDLQQRRRHLHS